MSRKVERPPVPQPYVTHCAQALAGLPECVQEDAWTGVRWRVRGSTVAHVFGGEDQLFRLVFRGEPDEVAAFGHLGERYFRAGWGGNVIGLLVDEATDWTEVRELLTDSYCLQAPRSLAETVDRPGEGAAEGGSAPQRPSGPSASGNR